MIGNLSTSNRNIWFWEAPVSDKCRPNGILSQKRVKRFFYKKKTKYRQKTFLEPEEHFRFYPTGTSVLFSNGKIALKPHVKAINWDGS